MYDMHKRAPVRTSESGFVIPSQNEWIKAAYFDRTGGGTYSYWWYPTNVGSPFFEGGSPTQVTLNPANGDVTNAGAGATVANFHAEGQEAPYWCPSNQTLEACETVNPLHLPAKAYKKAFQGSLNTVGQAATYGPWGTLEQGGNAVEWTDTITPPPFGAKGHRVWRRLHGGVPNAPSYQLWLSAVGLQPQKNDLLRRDLPVARVPDRRDRQPAQWPGLKESPSDVRMNTPNPMRDSSAVLRRPDRDRRGARPRGGRLGETVEPGQRIGRHRTRAAAGRNQRRGARTAPRPARLPLLRQGGEESLRPGDGR